MRICILLSFLIAICSCKSEQTAAKSNSAASKVQMTVVEKGSYSGMEQAQNILIKSAEEWASVWKNLHKTKSPAPAKPEIDFETQYVVAAFMGMRSNGGYSIEISDIQLADDMLQVKVLHHKAGKDCLTTMAIVHPYHLVTIEKSSIKDAEFTVEEKVNDCK